jgi:hypothetical protein
MVNGQSGFHGLYVLSAVEVVEFSIERETVQIRLQIMVETIVMEMVQRFSLVVMLDVQVCYPCINKKTILKLGSKFARTHFIMKRNLKQ